MNASKSIRRLFKAGMSLLLTAAWLWTIALGASAQLHSAVHADSQAPAHQCAVTEISHGKADAPAPVLTAAAPPALRLELPLPSPLPAPQDIDLRLDPGRAPPA
ncbi:MAG: hypothetical protein HY301_11360 [Verrucomicrobia bacterium]|nr:hypothetical protein [Verrucomicrobiota bacterium]